MSMKLKVCITALLLLALTGCAPGNSKPQEITSSKPALTDKQTSDWQLMSGRWYGSQPTSDGGTKEEIIDKLSDGTYQIVFKVTHPEKGTQFSVEVGYWGMSGDIYFSIFRGWIRDRQLIEANPSDPYHYDAYRIIRLDEELFEYKHVSNGNRYTLKRVPDNFQFPG